VSAIAPKTLFARLVLGLIVVSLCAVAATSGFLYLRYRSINRVLRERTLQSQAAEIARLVHETAPGRQVVLPRSLASDLKDEKAIFAVVLAAGGLLASSADVKGELTSLRSSKAKFFEMPAMDGGTPLYGISLPVPETSPRIWVQLAARNTEVLSDSVIEEFLVDIGWIWVPFLLSLLAINVGIARIGLRPLRHAATLAETLGPGTVSQRLPEAGLPTEVLALVRAVNQALDRLEEGYRAQRRFVAEAAHELRTPVAVLKAQLALSSPDSVERLTKDVRVMERLVNQLLEDAQLDALPDSELEVINLADVGADVVTFLAPMAVSRGRELALQVNGPAYVRAGYDFLFRAIRNVVENAVEHTPAGSTVTVTVDPRARGGAGLGLSIVSRTVNSYGGAIIVDENPGGGAVFTLSFPPPFKT
jgi:signal transduction histidine kinase